MNDCIFCKIVAEIIPAEKVFENDRFVAFLDVHPRGPGHVQLIPKEHYRWVWDVPAIGEYFEIARAIAKAQQRAFGIEMIRSQVFGDEVPHAHLWLWPNTQEHAEDIKINAQKLRESLRTSDSNTSE
ncbi:MAG: HIT domain-containing protein [bacterium]|nr:HIT domain-containing protein [bacterium]